jgi:hypothetical protein
MHATWRCAEASSSLVCAHLYHKASSAPAPRPTRSPVRAPERAECGGRPQVRALFAVAGVLQPAVIFIDEIDSILSARKSDGARAAL